MAKELDKVAAGMLDVAELVPRIMEELISGARLAPFSFATTRSSKRQSRGMRKSRGGRSWYVATATQYACNYTSSHYTMWSCMHTRATNTRYRESGGK